MSSIVRKNVHSLKRMGYEVEEIPELYEFRIMLRSKRNFGFSLHVKYYDLQSVDIIPHIVMRFNFMITNKLDIKDE